MSLPNLYLVEEQVKLASTFGTAEFRAALPDGLYEVLEGFFARIAGTTSNAPVCRVFGGPYTSDLRREAFAFGGDSTAAHIRDRRPTVLVEDEKIVVRLEGCAVDTYLVRLVLVRLGPVPRRLATHRVS